MTCPDGQEASFQTTEEVLVTIRQASKIGWRCGYLYALGNLTEPGVLNDALLLARQGRQQDRDKKKEDG